MQYDVYTFRVDSPAKTHELGVFNRMLRKYGGERMYKTTFLSGVQWQKERNSGGAFRRAMRSAAAFFSGVFLALGAGAFFLVQSIAGVFRRGDDATRTGAHRFERRHAQDGEPISMRGVARPEARWQSRFAMDSHMFLRMVSFTVAAILLLSGAVMIPPVTVLATTATVMLLDEDTGIATEIVTTANSVGELLDHYGVTLGVGDIVYPDRSQPIKDGQEIRIRRAMSVTTMADGVVSDLRIQAGTVREALAMAGIAYSADDIILPSLNTTLEPGMEISITRVEYEMVTETERLYYQKRIQKDETLYVGDQVVAQEGKEGEKEVDIRVAYHDGEEYSREVVEERVIAAAQHLIVKEGTKARPASPAGSSSTSSGSDGKAVTTSASASGNIKTDISITGKEYKRNDYWVYYQTRRYEIKKTLSVRATAYTHTGRRTATGVWPTLGTVAVDKSVIPLGTRLYIPGYGICKAQDTGGAIKGEKIDIFFDTEEECIRWGNKSITIYIIGPPIYDE
jgi:uncharacterized protein YabE (DUF348 family)/3D (Asp-Asp-Asp) domain-containing protein